MERETDMAYWTDSGTHQALLKNLYKLIPAEGSVSDPALERFRVISNAYYDLFNNLGCNRSSDIRKHLGSVMKLAKQRKWDAVYQIVEPKIDAAILDAAKEQGLI